MSFLYLRFYTKSICYHVKLPLNSLHVLWNSRPFIQRIVIVLLFNPSINRVSRFSVLADVHALELNLRLDAEQAEVVQGEEHDEAASGGPQHDANASGNVDAEQVPRLSGMTLKVVDLKRTFKQLMTTQV